MKQFFSEVLFALLLLLRLVVCDIGGVASLVIGVITLNNIIVLSLFNHLNLVNTSLAISTSYSSKAHISVFTTLTLGTTSKSLRRSSLMMLFMVSMMMMMILTVLVEGEGTNERLTISAGFSSQLASAKDALTTNQEDQEELSIHD